MAVVSATSNPAALSFKWMDILEKEFDKSFVSLEELLRGVADDYEIPDVYESNRKLLTSLGSCFIQVYTVKVNNKLFMQLG